MGVRARQWLGRLRLGIKNHDQGALDRGQGPALASITEAVGIHRQLADADPAAFLPDLAMSLNNLSIQQSHTGTGVLRSS